MASKGRPSDAVDPVAGETVLGLVRLAHARGRSLWSSQLDAPQQPRKRGTAARLGRRARQRTGDVHGSRAGLTVSGRAGNGHRPLLVVRQARFRLPSSGCAAARATPHPARNSRRLSRRRFVVGDVPGAERVTGVSALLRCSTKERRDRRAMGRTRTSTATRGALDAILSAARKLPPEQLQEASPTFSWVEVVFG